MFNPYGLLYGATAQLDRSKTLQKDEQSLSKAETQQKMDEYFLKYPRTKEMIKTLKDKKGGRNA